MEAKCDNQRDYFVLARRAILASGVVILLGLGAYRNNWLRGTGQSTGPDLLDPNAGLEIAPESLEIGQVWESTRSRSWWSGSTVTF
jgi:hypothetical protein